MVASVLPGNSPFRPSVLIPVYNHEMAIGPTLDEVLIHDCPVLLVDDGSSPSCRDVLTGLRDRNPDRVSLVRLAQNAGKGAAVKAGFSALRDNGFSHAIQIDADGQHDISDLPLFLETGRNNPGCVVTGCPEFDDEIPRIRFYCRYLTHVCVWINTLSLEIRDTMCGFRVYPIAAMADLLLQEKCGNRMDFDTEIMVRWHWRGGRTVNLPTRVRYPIDGVSHFRMWQDNVLLTRMHMKLFFGMLYRLPRIISRKFRG